MASSEVTRLLLDWNNGDQKALDALMALLYDELRSMARSYMSRERAGHTLQPTALVHEVYLRLVDQTSIQWQNRAQFLGVAAQIMRRILVDHARHAQAAKRGGAARPLPLSEIDAPGEDRPLDLLLVDDALSRLAALDAGKSRIVELKFFGGLEIEEIAEVVKLSPRTVARHWRAARAWLYGEVTAQLAGQQS